MRHIWHIKTLQLWAFKRQRQSETFCNFSNMAMASYSILNGTVCQVGAGPRPNCLNLNRGFFIIIFEAERHDTMSPALHQVPAHLRGLWGGHTMRLQGLCPNLSVLSCSFSSRMLHLYQAKSCTHKEISRTTYFHLATREFPHY